MMQKVMNKTIKIKKIKKNKKNKKALVNKKIMSKIIKNIKT